MSQLTLARRYAQALLEVAVEEESVQEIEEQILSLGEVYESSSELSELLTDPLVNQQKKMQILEDLFSEEIREDVMNLLRLLMEKGRAELIPVIADTFDTLADDHFGVVNVEVESARPLEDEQVDKLKEQMENLLGGQQVELNETENPELLAGFRIKIGDSVLDGTLSNRLKKLRENLTRSEAL